MNPVETWHAEAIGENAVKALRKNGFDAHYFDDRGKAVEAVMKFVKPGATVGLGGSMTVRALGIPELLRAAGAVLLDHSVPGLSAEEKLEVLRKQLTCDVFITSSNGVTLEGDIVNVDGNGNRVAALAFGPSKTVVVVGANKIVRDVEEALARIETTASPMNNKRLDRPNPCVKTGTCEDCQGESRICRVYQILRKRPSLSDFTVVIIGESLGY